MRFSPSIQWVFKVQDAFSPESISARGQVFRSCTSFLWLPNRKVNFSSHSEEEKVFCDGRSSRMPKTQHQEITQPMPYTETQQILWQLTRLPSATALLCSSACTCSGLCPRQSLERDSLSLSMTVPLFTGALCKLPWLNWYQTVSSATHTAAERRMKERCTIYRPCNSVS